MCVRLIVYICVFWFWLQYGMQFYWYLCENIKLEGNKVDNFEALHCTMALILLEMGCKEVVVELIRLGLDMQVSVLYTWSVELKTFLTIHETSRHFSI